MLTATAVARIAVSIGSDLTLMISRGTYRLAVASMGRAISTLRRCAGIVGMKGRNNANNMHDFTNVLRYGAGAG